MGGPLALIRTGDLVSLNVPARRIDMLVPEAELAARKQAWQAPAPKFDRGFGVLYLKHVGQADSGCDFDFLQTRKAEHKEEPEIH
ncbi:dehydratase family protein [Bordetella holmesii 30539]|uniref:Dehydratase family protein n=1 Tax=Bordetella holmesii 1058 TaxID=1247648 RepID=A0ABP3BE06_9BORD|nr:dehydratase family protein [Bordetella holmesii 44057]EWM44166.1 dehydratase family protein [Bordetella holmesii 41130]EXF87372.1 dehydratase family protein [Bordetella holmesii 30539]EXX93377.1 dehydratase family protein [Bordetella holmesii 1058]KAK79535.1 dehydratase domain protein [Bordetella holmesii CDC-H809-BH]KAK80725.1 dehydratase domain protein [Bordetella holmesii H620]KAK84980.1 dehydratase domain protein [Bordetella holmesii CDC-H572-BH]KCV03500.1 dehydratase domain protein [